MVEASKRKKRCTRRAWRKQSAGKTAWGGCLPCVRPSDVRHAAGRRKTSRDRGTSRSFRIRHADALQPMVVSLCCLFPSLDVWHHPDSACTVTSPCAQFKCLKRRPGRPATRTDGRNRHHRSRGPPPVPKSRVCPCPSHPSSPIRIHVARSVSHFRSTCQTTVLHSLACSSASQLADPVGSSPPDRCAPLVNTVDLTALSSGSAWDEVYDRVNRRSGRGRSRGAPSA